MGEMGLARLQCFYLFFSMKARNGFIADFYFLMKRKLISKNLWEKIQIFHFNISFHGYMEYKSSVITLIIQIATVDLLAYVYECT